MLRAILLLLLVVFISNSSNATIRYAVATGNWSSTATWSASSAGASGASVPTATDSVIIENAFTVTVDVASSCVYLRIIPKTTANIVTQLSIASALTVGSGGMYINGANNVIRLSKVLFTTASSVLTVNGNLAIGDGLGVAATAVFDMSNAVNQACTLNVSGTFSRNTVDGSFVPGTGSLVNFNGSNAQTIDLTNLTYANIQISNSNTNGATLGAAMTTTNVSGNVNVASGKFRTGNFNMGLNASKTLTVASGATMDAGSSVITMGTSGVVTVNGTFLTSSSSGFQGATASAISSTNNPTINLGANSTISLTGVTVSLSAGTYSSVDLSSGGTLTATGNLIVSGNFNISNGTFVGGNFTHKVRGNWNMSGGSFVNTGTTIELDGSTVQTISSTGAFNNLTVNTGADSVALASNITVDGALALTRGKVSINSRTLTIGTAGSISGYDNTKYIIADNNGTLDQRVINGNSKVFPIGHPTGYFPANVGLTISSTSDYFKVRILNVLRQQGTSGNPVTSDAVDVTWFISEAVGGNSDATITLTWPANMELTGFNRSACRIGHWTSGAWEYGSTDLVASGSGPYSVSRSGFTSFSPFSVGEIGVLPVKWSYAKGQSLKTENRVIWGTASEYNNGRFEIEASVDGVNFTLIGTVQAAGNSSTEKHYEFIDSDPLSAITYYRVKQIDHDGKFEYSQLIVVKAERTEISIYPNPAVDQLNLVNGLDGTKVSLIDIQGTELLSSTFVNSKTSIDISSLPKGIYFISYFNGSGTSLSRFVKIQD